MLKRLPLIRRSALQYLQQMDFVESTDCGVTEAKCHGHYHKLLGRCVWMFDRAVSRVKKKQTQQGEIKKRAMREKREREEEEGEERKRPL